MEGNSIDRPFDPEPVGSERPRGSSEVQLMDALQNEIREGYVMFLPWGPGTRSESRQPFLVENAGALTRLFRPGDNPFDHESLWPCHCHWCSISGQWDNEKEVLLVKEIKILDDPALR